MKKIKPWEAQIPFEGSKYLNFDNYHNCYKRLPKIQSNKHIIIDLPFGEIDNVMDWIKRNKIPLCNWEFFNSSFTRHVKYIFRFKTEEDAMAFKLRWC